MVRKEYEHKARLNDGIPVLSCRFGKNKPWVDITHTRYDVQKLTFKDLDDNECKISNCKVKLVDLILEIVFNFVCFQILYENNVIWNFFGYMSPFIPKSISFDLVKNKFFLNPWTGASCELDTRIHVVGNTTLGRSNGVLHIDDPYNEKTKHLKITYFDEPIRKIMCGRKIIWKHRRGQLPPVKFVGDMKKGIRYILFPDKYIIAKIEGNKWQITEHETNPEDKLLNLIQINEYMLDLIIIYKFNEMNGVKLDIDIKKSTDKFEHRFVNDFRSYNCILGKKFTSVREEGFVIWESENANAGANSVFISERKERFVLILLGNEYKLFHKPGKESTWSDITSERIKFKGICLSYNNDLKEKIDYDYKIRMFEYMFYFKECNEVWYMGTLIWRFSENFIGKTPKGFYVNLINNSFRLNYGDKRHYRDTAPRIKLFKMANDEFVEMTHSDYITVKDYKWFAFKFIFNEGLENLRITLDGNILWEGESKAFYSLLIDESDERIQIESYDTIITLHHSFSFGNRNLSDNSRDKNLPADKREFRNGNWKISENKIYPWMKIYHYPLNNRIGLVGRALYNVELIYPGCFEYNFKKSLKIAAVVIDWKTAYVHEFGRDFLKTLIYDENEEELEYFSQGKLIQRKWVGMEWQLKIDKHPHLNILEPGNWKELCNFDFIDCKNTQLNQMIL
uniref:SfiI-subtelomeric related protein family member, putative n=1 Tax=Theileria annulata TaxID=5874 RepID=A0A3B0NFP2_THEAN